MTTTYYLKDSLACSWNYPNHNRNVTQRHFNKYPRLNVRLPVVPLLLFLCPSQVQRRLYVLNVFPADRLNVVHLRTGGLRAVGLPEHRRVYAATTGEYQKQATGKWSDNDRWRLLPPQMMIRCGGIGFCFVGNLCFVVAEMIAAEYSVAQRRNYIVHSVISSHGR